MFLSGVISDQESEGSQGESHREEKEVLVSGRVTSGSKAPGSIPWEVPTPDNRELGRKKKKIDLFQPSWPWKELWVYSRHDGKTPKDFHERKDPVWPHGLCAGEPGVKAGWILSSWRRKWWLRLRGSQYNRKKLSDLRCNYYEVGANWIWGSFLLMLCITCTLFSKKT